MLACDPLLSAGELEKKLQESCTCSPPSSLSPSSSIANYFLQTFSLNCSAALKLIELQRKFPWKIWPNNLQVKEGGGMVDCCQSQLRLRNIPECWHNPRISLWAVLVNFLQSEIICLRFLYKSQSVKVSQSNLQTVSLFLLFSNNLLFYFCFDVLTLHQPAVITNQSSFLFFWKVWLLVEARPLLCR